MGYRFYEYKKGLKMTPFISDVKKTEAKSKVKKIAPISRKKKTARTKLTRQSKKILKELGYTIKDEHTKR